MRSAEAILIEVFDPSGEDCQTCREDLQLAVTLNPSLELVEQAINEARREAIKEAAEVAESLPGGNHEAYGPVNKQSILDLLNHIK